MAHAGYGVTLAPSQRIDRRDNLRRSSSLNARHTRYTWDKPSDVPRLTTDSRYTLGHHRSLSDKMKSLQFGKRRDNDIPTGKPHATAAGSLPTRKIPKHLDLMEAVSRRDHDGSHRRQFSDETMYRRIIGMGTESVLAEPKGSDGPCSSTVSSRPIAPNHPDLKPGTAKNERPKPAAVQRLRPFDTPLPRMNSDMSAKTNDSMEVNFHIASQDVPAPSLASAKDRRPKIQVTIPTTPSKKAGSSSHLVHQMQRQRTRTKHVSQQVSPPSSISRQQIGEVPARMSIVSPLSVVEMPRPRRPFSTLSLEDMTSDGSPELPRSAPLMHQKMTNSDSEDSFDQDDRSSNYSPLSSISSILSDTPSNRAHSRRHSIAFSVMSPTDAGVFDSRELMPPVIKIRKNSKSKKSMAVNKNKPLPPEPCLEEVAPLRVSGTYASSMRGKRKAPLPLSISRSSTISTIRAPMQNQPRLSVASIRSKYSPADLDALDSAFTKTSPYATSPSYHDTSLEQAQLELEAHLGTIEEDDHASGIVSYVNDPLQISRGPNEMIPSRAAPPPPTAQNIKLSDGSIGNRKRLQKQPSTHVALQMKTEQRKDNTSNTVEEKRSAPMGGNMLKANKILGKTGNVTPMQREVSNESNWSSSEAPASSETSFTAVSSPDFSNREDSATPETDVSSVPDYALEEIRARLELLSPKDESQKLFSNLYRPRADAAESSYSVQSSTEDQSISPHTVSTQPTQGSPENQDESDAFKALFSSIVDFAPRDERQEVKTTIPIIVEQADDSQTRTVERRGRHSDALSRSFASIAVSEIPELYAQLPSPQSTVRNSLTAEEIEQQISADAAEVVLLRVLENLDNLQDLFATATVSRGFYRTFKRHELPLMKNALYGMSPAAWELREVCSPYPGLEGTSPTLDYSPAVYLQHYMRDMYTMIALKSMILIHCESFLRADTITALAGGETERASHIDDAFWRVWTFCKIFGCSSNREEDITSQLDWLRGGVDAKQLRIKADADGKKAQSAPSFGHGNTGGLSAEDLYDMTEIWTCLGVLVRGFQGKREEARDHGVFDNADITVGDVEAEDLVLDEWTYHLLTLAPPSILDVTSPTTPTAKTFAQAQARGYTAWTPPTVSRATFLKEAVSRIYQEKMSEKHPTSVPSSPTKANPNEPDFKTKDSEGVVAARWRVARHAAEIRAKRNDPNFKYSPPSEDRPMSNYPRVLEKLDPIAAPPVPAIPSIHTRTTSEADTSKSMVSALVVPAGPQVRDPVDVAVERLVAMGFESRKAKKALADTDTGNSIDFEAALEWLVRARKRDVSGIMHAGYRGRVGGEREGDEQGICSAVSPMGMGEGIGLGVDMF